MRKLIDRPRGLRALREELFEKLVSLPIEMRLYLEKAEAGFPVAAQEGFPELPVSFRAQLGAADRQAVSPDVHQALQQKAADAGIFGLLHEASYKGNGRTRVVGIAPCSAMIAGSDPALSIVACGGGR